MPLFQRVAPWALTWVLASLGAVAAAAAPDAASRAPAATDYAVLHSFSGMPDGAGPGGLVVGPGRTLYGVTAYGGRDRAGTIFRLDARGRLRTLHSFERLSAGGSSPNAGLIRASDGALYGTTRQGSELGGGRGTVYRLAADGAHTVLHTFRGGADDGAVPIHGLVEHADGHFYGFTALGGVWNQGTFYRLTRQGEVTLLHSFGGTAAEASSPRGTPVMAADGALYGVTSAGGVGGQGVLFRITTAGELTVLHAFELPFDGLLPNAGLTLGLDGRLYGSTYIGGDGCFSGCGTLFVATLDGAVTVLHRFNETDGAFPTVEATAASDGRLYGSTFQGGAHGRGTLWVLGRDGGLRVLRSIDGDGSPWPFIHPQTLVEGPDRRLYGSHGQGGVAGKGSLFRLDRSPAP